MRTIYVVVNLDGAIGAVEWRDEQDDLPTFGSGDQHYVVNVPENVASDDAAITEEMDAFLGEYDLPEGWECGPIFGDDDEQPYYFQNLDSTNRDDLLAWMESGVLVGIVSEADGGIIGYTHRERASQFVSALSKS